MPGAAARYTSVSGHDLTLVGAWEDRPRPLQRRGRFGLVSVDALKDDVVPRVQAGEPGRVEDADTPEAAIARLLRLLRSGVPPVRLRQREEYDRPAALAAGPGDHGRVRRAWRCSGRRRLRDRGCGGR